MRLSEIDLDSLPVIHFNRRWELPPIQAVYFIYIGEELAYVGFAQDLRRRIRATDHRKRFEASNIASVRWLDCSPFLGWPWDPLFRDIERYFLAQLSPPYNQMHTARNKCWPLNARRQHWLELGNSHLLCLTASYGV